MYKESTNDKAQLQAKDEIGALTESFKPDGEPTGAAESGIEKRTFNTDAIIYRRARNGTSKVVA